VAGQSGIITGLTAELDNLKTQLENVKTSKAELNKTARQLMGLAGIVPKKLIRQGIREVGCTK
jgi:hypothetical protein